MTAKANVNQERRKGEAVGMGLKTYGSVEVGGARGRPTGHGCGPTIYDKR
jgi:hypothetical protein